MPGTLYQNPNLWNESVSSVTAANTVQLGSQRWESGNKYIYMFMDGASPASAVPGQCVNLVSGGSGYSVTTSMSVGDYAFGVIQNTTMTTSTYGWVMQQGVGRGYNVSAVSTANLLAVSTSGLLLNWTYAASGGTAGTPVTVVGRSLTSAASATSILAAFSFPSA